MNSFDYFFAQSMHVGSKINDVWEEKIFIGSTCVEFDLYWKWMCVN